MDNDKNNVCIIVTAIIQHRFFFLMVVIKEAELYTKV